MSGSLNFLCISSEVKGEAFMRTCKAQGNRVFLLTSEHLREDAWPWDAIDDVFYLPQESSKDWKAEDLIAGLSFTFRETPIHRIVSLDDFEVELAAELREYFRIPGMGQTTAKYFRDKLSMRLKAEEHGIPVPAFTALFNDAEIQKFTENVSAPWLIKPRTAASASGIIKIHNSEQLWDELHKLGAQRHEYLLEKFAPGSVYHVDSINYEGKPSFTLCSKYLDTPLEVAHGGGIFRSQTLKRNTKEDKLLKKLNSDIMDAFGMAYSASHTEFIRNHETGEFYFLETSSRVGGAHLAEMVEAASGVNLWSEWALLEDCIAKDKKYKTPNTNYQQAGILVSLIRFQHPENSAFNDHEIVWRMKKDWHIGMIVASSDHDRITELLDKYAKKVAKDFHAKGA